MTQEVKRKQDGQRHSVSRLGKSRRAEIRNRLALARVHDDLEKIVECAAGVAFRCRRFLRRKL